MARFSSSVRTLGAPTQPRDYRENMDPGLRTLSNYASKAGERGDPEWHVGELRKLLGLFPLRRIEQAILEEGADAVLESVLTPYVEAEALAYSRGIGAFQRTLPPLPPECILPFNILWAGDPDTAKHSVDTGYVTAAFRVALGSDEEGRPFIGEQSALHGLVHDFGKPDSIPRILLENPVFRNLMPALYAVELRNPNRQGKPIVPPFPLSPEQAQTFGPLLSGEHIHPDQVRAFVELCSQYKGPIDYRVIPVRALLNFGRSVLKDGTLPSDVQMYVDTYMKGRVQPGDVDFMIEKLRTQKKEYKWMNWILARFGIDGWRDSFKDVIERHESASASMVPPELGCVIKDHHGYDQTNVLLTARGIVLPPPLQRDIYALQLGDISSALGANRVYFKSGQAFDPEQIGKIAGSAVVRRGCDPELMRYAVSRVMPNKSGPSVLRSIFEKIHHSGLAVYS